MPPSNTACDPNILGGKGFKLYNQRKHVLIGFVVSFKLFPFHIRDFVGNTSYNWLADATVSKQEVYFMHLVADVTSTIYKWHPYNEKEVKNLFYSLPYM